MERGELVLVVVRWWWRWADLGAAVKRVVCQDLLGGLRATSCSSVPSASLLAERRAMWRGADEAVLGPACLC